MISARSSSLLLTRRLSPTSRAKISLSRELRIEKGLSHSKSTVTFGLLQVFSKATLAEMLQFLSQIVKRDEEPTDKDLHDFERKFQGELRKAKPSDIVGIYKLLQLHTELDKCAERIKELSGVVWGAKTPSQE